MWTGLLTLGSASNLIHNTEKYVNIYQLILCCLTAAIKNLPEISFQVDLECLSFLEKQQPLESFLQRYNPLPYRRKKIKARLERFLIDQKANNNTTILLYPLLAFNFYFF